MNNRIFKSVLVLSLLLVSLINLTSAAPGDSRAEAEEIFLGETTGELISSSDRHYFVFDADPNTTIAYEIDLYGPSNTDFDMTIEDGNGNHIDGIYGVSYPDSATVGGHDTYYLEVYSAAGSGDFTIDITQKTAQPGQSPSNPILLQLGDNLVNFDSDSNIYVEFDSIEGKFYRFDLIVQGENTQADAYFSNQQRSSNAYNSTHSSQGQSAYMAGNSNNITGEVYQYSNSKSPGLIIRITELTPPDGVDPNNPVSLTLDETININVIDGITAFLSFIVEDSDYYSIQFIGIEQGWGYANIYSDTYSGSFNIDQGRDIYLKSSPGNHTLELNFQDFSGNISVVLSRDSPPLGYSRDIPLPVGEEEINSNLIGSRLYLQPNVDQGSSYLINWATVTGQEIYFEIVFEFEEYSTYTYANGPSGNAFFYVETAPMIIQVRTWDHEYSGNMTFSLDSIPNPDHVAMSDAKIASLGVNSGEIQYQSQPFWFQFTAPEAGTYNFELDVATQVYFEMILVDSSGNHRSWGDSWGGIEYNAYQNEVLYLRILNFDSQGSSTFTLEINEGELQEEIREEVYSDNLQAGDYFEWYVEVFENGQPAESFGDFFSHESTVRLDVLADTLIIPEHGDRDDYFELSSTNGATGSDVDLFLLPVEIREGGRTVSTRHDIISLMFDAGYPNSEIIETNGEITVSISDSDFYESFNFELVFDAEIMNLISLEYSVETDGDLMEIFIELTDSRISGPPENIDDNEPAIQLPVSIYSVLFGILMLPVIRRKVKY